jgi:hypothetical protein
MLVFLLVLHASRAAAQVAQQPITQLRNADDVARVLRDEAADATLWRVSWTVINSGLTLLTFGGLLVLPRAERAELLVAGVASALSTGVSWWWALDVEDDAVQAAKLARLPAPQRAAHMQRLFEHSARDEAARLTWPWHVGNFVSALVPAAISWLLLHHRQAALFSLVSGFALGEVEMLTQPTGLLRWQRNPHGKLSVALERSGALIMYDVAF